MIGVITLTDKKLSFCLVVASIALSVLFAPSLSAQDTMEAEGSADTEMTESADTEANEVSGDEEMLPEELSINERVRREEQYLLGETELMQARELLAENKFEEAVAQLDSAIAHYRNAGRTEAIQQRIAMAQSVKENVYTAWAENLASEGQRLAESAQIDDAVDKMRQAIELNPDNEAAYRERIRYYSDLKKQAEIREATSEKQVLPDKDTRTREIAILLGQGRVLLDDGRLTDARDKFEEILVKIGRASCRERVCHRV